MELLKFIEKVETNRVAVISHWINNPVVVNILNAYGINKEYFIKEFAISILTYYADIVKGKEEIGNCPNVDRLVDFLKFNSIKAQELFLLCSGFKNALVSYMFELDAQNKELEEDINYIFEQNFAGMLQSFLNKENSEDLKRLLVLSDKNIIMSSTDKEGVITSVSQAFCEISGYTKEELVGQPHSIVRHPDMQAFIFEDMWETIQNGQTWRGEIKNLKKDGGYYWIYATIEPHYDKEGNIVGYDALRQDITSKKELEEQQSIIVEQSKSAAMGEMISMIAHQWRQPLQAVSILVQKIPLTKMIEGELSDEFIDKVVDDVSLQLNYMSKTIDDFRDFFKPEKAKQKIKCSELTFKAQEFLNYMFKVDEIDFENVILNDANLNLHVNEVVQVLINILKNARDAMLEKEIQNRKIVVSHDFNDKYAIIEIQDNAGGIPPDIIARIFDPYFSTEKSKNGTGLGLYMSKKIIEQYCLGKISVKNKNDGVVFRIELPLQ